MDSRIWAKSEMIKKHFKSFAETLSLKGRKINQEKNSVITGKVSHLRKRGFVVLDHLVGSDLIKQVQIDIAKNFEQDFNIKYPCLAQSKIDDHEHNDLIQSNFLATPETLTQRGLTFNREDVENYQQMLRDFQPSTLTLPMPSIKNYYDLWLDPMVMDLVSAYMGFVPELTEAYVRRNFPFNYRVMNHYWHRDSNHSKHLLKAFVFFTDCDIKTGAHHYIAGSVDDERFRDKTYYSDEEINDVWPIESENHMVSTVPAGTIIIEDTRGLHKAGHLEQSYRDLGYAVFLPPNHFKKSPCLYTIEDNTFDTLSDDQKRFIPSKNIRVKN